MRLPAEVVPPITVAGVAMSKRYSGERAVVIGAGMGGLPATQVLADHFRGVVVLERDVLPADATPRPGVPQGKLCTSTELRSPADVTRETTHADATQRCTASVRR